MGQDDELANVRSCAVRIAVENGQNLKGSGTLFVRKRGDYALVFTAAHVVKGIFEKPHSTEVQLYLSLMAGTDASRTIQLSVKLISIKSKVEAEPGCIYVHKAYAETSLENDAAIICVPWEDWMDSLQPFTIDKCQLGTEQNGCGFPESMNCEWKNDGQNELAGILQFKGNAVGNSDSRYSVRYTPNVSGTEISRDNMMEGFSGGGLFEQHNGSPVLTGIISKSCGDETAGGMLWACDATLFLDIMKENEIKLEVPESFQQYKDSIVMSFASHRRDARDYFSEKAEDLIENAGLKPEDFIEKSYSELRCDGRKEICGTHWEGQLKKAVIFCGLNGIQKDKIMHPLIAMPVPHATDKVQVEFLCTEASVEEVICELVKNDYFSKDGILKDKTIFLLNGKKGKIHEKDLFSRSDFRGIMVDIAGGELKSYAKHTLYKKMQGLWPEKEQMSTFNIISGNLSECNLALVGIGRLMETIEQGEGQEEKMKKKMGDLLTSLWEV